jgi:hypothetical protein
MKNGVDRICLSTADFAVVIEEKQNPLKVSHRRDVQVMNAECQNVEKLLINYERRMSQCRKITDKL